MLRIPKDFDAHESVYKQRSPISNDAFNVRNDFNMCNYSELNIPCNGRSNEK